MTYSQLKNLEMPTLFALVQRTLDAQFDLTPNQFVQGSPLPPPTLFLIGDFEIRARFIEERNPTPIDSNPEDLQYIDALKARCERLELNLAENLDCRKLIYAVASVFPGETRYQTALRYIRERESQRHCGTEYSGGTG